VAKGSAGNPLLIRILSLGGFLLTACMILLGGVYPSYFTIIAIPVLPAPFAFGTLLFRPALALKWPRLRVYLAASVAISAASILAEFILT
jgi:hypothetical protein